MEEIVVNRADEPEDEEACCVTCGYPVSQCACGEQATCPNCHKAYVFCTCSSEK